MKLAFQIGSLPLTNISTQSNFSTNLAANSDRASWILQRLEAGIFEEVEQEKI